MDITNQGKAAIQSGADAIETAAHQVRRGSGEVAQHAARGARRAGREISSFVQRRPVETALLSAAAACLISGIAFWYTRRD